MKTFRLAALMFLSIVFGFMLFVGPGTVDAQHQDEQKKEKILFQWAFGALVKAEHGSNLVAITRDTELKTGNQFKMFLQLRTKCFLYFIYHSSQGELSVLFPYRFDQLSTECLTSKEYYIPQSDEWFEFDEHPGKETFYLLASASRLRSLETLINNYETADSAKKPESAARVLKEIRNLRWQHREFKIYAEKPVNIMGQTRGSDEVKKKEIPDVADLAVEISANNFYSRTFTIDHQ